jgi:hypothetical protein
MMGKNTAMILTESRRDTYLPLVEAGVPESALERLAALGITTLEELRDLWTYGERQLLVDYLADSPIRFVSYPPPAGVSRGKAASGPGTSINLLAASPAPPLVKRPRGVTLTTAQRRQEALPPLPVPLDKHRAGTVTSLVDRFPPARDQFQRGTCVAFASIAYLEFHLYDASPKTQHHAEQFVYWACKELDGLGQVEGTYVRIALQVLRTRGACLAKTWPYEPLPVGPTEGQGPPRNGAEEEANRHTWAAARKMAATNVQRLRERIDQQQPVVLSVKTFPCWDHPAVESTGEVPLPVPGTRPDGGHAVCVVGYELRDDIAGGGAFVFRNSWGRKWARRKGRFGEGYGTLAFDYVTKYGLEAFA